jgi:hypothetical protein
VTVEDTDEIRTNFASETLQEIAQLENGGVEGIISYSISKKRE